MKVVSLIAENIKRLKAVRIEPGDSVTVIGGNNEQGKTCVLDSIEYALRGAGSIPSKPIREGEKAARVVLDLEDIEVIRTFTAKGTKLIVKNKDGATFASPQAILDKLTGELTFDPLEFSRMKPQKQAEVLRKLVGLDFLELEAEYKQLFDKRTDINRQGKAMKGQIDGMTQHEGVPDTEVSITELTDRYDEASVGNRERESLDGIVKRDGAELVGLRQRVKELTSSLATNKKLLEKTTEVDLTHLRTEISEAEGLNTKIRESLAYGLVNEKLVALRAESQSLGDQLSVLTTTKTDLLASAKFPIQGLSIDDDIVSFDSIPFDQCSTAQGIRVSVAMGLAMNPALKLLLIRDGSMLDAKNLAMIDTMAEEADAQVLIERVGKGKECQVIIEDGEVVGD